MASQTEYQRGFWDGVNKTKQAAAINILNIWVEVPKQEKEA